jgi:hypothetical protein
VLTWRVCVHKLASYLYINTVVTVTIIIRDAHSPLKAAVYSI